MGGGIAMNFASVGIPVTVVEVNREALERGLGVVRKNYEATASKGRLTAADVETRMGPIQGTTDWGPLAPCGACSAPTPGPCRCGEPPGCSASQLCKGDAV